MMASGLLGSFPVASSTSMGGSCWRSKRYANNYNADLWYKARKVPKEYCIMTSLQQNLKHCYKGIRGGSTCIGFKRHHIINATSNQSYEPEAQDHESRNILDSIQHAMKVFIKFIRPPPIIYMVLSAISMSLISMETTSDLSPAFFIGLLQHIAAFTCVQIYTVGINQLADIEIDKISKPDLPLASGELSITNGVIITISSIIMAIGIGWMVGSRPLLWGTFISFMLSSAYSIDLPLLRWKGSTTLTVVFSIAYYLIGFVLTPFLHMKTFVLNQAITFPRPLIFTIAFLLPFNLAMSFYKDIPDIEGDKAVGIQTVAARLGPKRAFWFCISLFEMAYGVAIIMGTISPFLWSKIFTGLAHATIALIIWNRAKSVDVESYDALLSFYMFLWVLGSAEYLLIPFVR